MKQYPKPSSIATFETFEEHEMKHLFLSYFGCSQSISQSDLANPDNINQMYKLTLDQFYHALQGSSQNTKTSKKLEENLLSFQKQIENPRYDFKGLEFEVFKEDVIQNDFKSLSYQISKAHYIDKLSMYFQSSEITDETVRIISLIFVLNSNLKALKIYLGMNNKLTNLSFLYLLTSLALNNNIQSLEIEFNNCDNLDFHETTRLLSSFLHYKAEKSSLVEINLSGGFALINKPLIPANLSTLEKIDLHVSNKIPKCDDLLINICHGLQNNSNVQTFSLDFKNNKLTERGILTLAHFLRSNQQQSTLKELRLSLSGVEEDSNASNGLPKLGEVLSQMSQLYKLELNFNDFQIVGENFRKFLNFLKKKQGASLQWFMISYKDNPKIKLEDEIILGEIYAKNFLLYGQSIDITNNEISILNGSMTDSEARNMSYQTIKEIGESISNYSNCQTLDLRQFRANPFNQLQQLVKYAHISAGCNTNSFIQTIRDLNQPQWRKFDSFILINKLQIIAAHKVLINILPISLPYIVYDLREDVDVKLSEEFCM